MADAGWQDLGAALALVLVLEGITPFLDPARAKRLFALAATLGEGTLRTVGLLAMVAGLILLHLVR